MLGNAPADSSCASREGAPSDDGARVSGAAAVFASVLAVAITDAIERFDLSELAIDRFELLPQPLDVAVDRAVVDVNMLAIGRIHQLVAVFDMAGTLRQRFENEE